jgi:hypothetical protein
MKWISCQNVDLTCSDMDLLIASPKISEVFANIQDEYQIRAISKDLMS